MRGQKQIESDDATTVVSLKAFGFLRGCLFSPSHNFADLYSRHIAVLSAIFALRLGMSPLEVTGDDIQIMSHASISNNTHFAGTTEIGPLLFTLTGGNKPLTDFLNISLACLGLTAMVLVFRRHRQSENIHFAVLALFSLWYVYHRTYDSVICILSAALLMNFISQKKFLTFSLSWLMAMFLLALSIPGLLMERLHFTTQSLSANPAGLLGLHIERLLVFTMFWSFLFCLRKDDKLKPVQIEFKK